MTHIISILNHKGGVGKTASVANIGEALARMGRTVLLIDLDAQANLTTLYAPRLGVVEIHETILQAFRTRSNLPCYKVTENLYLTPSCLEFAGIEVEMVGKIRSEDILSNLLARDKNGSFAWFDYVLIDTPPSLGLITYNALLVADQVLVPLVPEPMALKGLNTISQICRQLTEAVGRQVQINGIFLTRKERGTVQEMVANEARQIYGEDTVLRSAIRKCVAVVQAPLVGKSLFDYAPDCTASLDYQALAREIEQRIEN